MGEALVPLFCGSSAVLLAEVGKGWILANLTASTEKESKNNPVFDGFDVSVSPSAP